LCFFILWQNTKRGPQDTALVITVVIKERHGVICRGIVRSGFDFAISVSNHAKGDASTRLPRPAGFVIETFPEDGDESSQKVM